MLSYSDLRLKEVIRVCDASTVGCVTDLMFDECTARVSALCVTPMTAGALFGRKKRCGVISVPWDAIVRIGEHCILVNLGM